MDDALTYLLAFVHSTALAAAQYQLLHSDNATTNEQWWAANAPLLERHITADAYPLASLIGTAAGQAHGGTYDPEHAYRFGLKRTLDGLAALIERRPSHDADQPAES
jgi:hypothetical protein